MNFLFLGDIVGRAGRNIIIEKLESIKQQYEIDFVIANGENSAGGYGITEEICNQLYDAGVDVITSGNHIWDQKERNHESYHKRKPTSKTHEFSRRNSWKGI
jgi:calcineurin-like phosphoesterase